MDSWQEELWWKGGGANSSAMFQNPVLKGRQMQDVREIRKSLDEGQCSCCKQGFFSSALDDQGRCKVCAERDLKPGNLTQEFDKVKSPEQQRENLKAIVKEILRELKEEEKAEKQAQKFKPKKCKKCGEEFLPRAAAHTVCDDCQVLERQKRKSK